MPHVMTTPLTLTITTTVWIRLRPSPRTTCSTATTLFKQAPQKNTNYDHISSLSSHHHISRLPPSQMTRQPVKGMNVPVKQRREKKHEKIIQNKWGRTGEAEKRRSKSRQPENAVIRETARNCSDETRQEEEDKTQAEGAGEGAAAADWTRGEQWPQRAAQRKTNNAACDTQRKKTPSLFKAGRQARFTGKRERERMLVWVCVSVCERENVFVCVLLLLL